LELKNEAVVEPLSSNTMYIVMWIKHHITIYFELYHDLVQ